MMSKFTIGHVIKLKNEGVFHFQHDPAFQNVISPAETGTIIHVGNYVTWDCDYVAWFNIKGIAVPLKEHDIVDFSEQLEPEELHVESQDEVVKLQLEVNELREELSQLKEYIGYTECSSTGQSRRVVNLSKTI